MNDGNEISSSAGRRVTTNDKIIDPCNPSALRAQVLGGDAHLSTNSITRCWTQGRARARRSPPQAPYMGPRSRLFCRMTFLASAMNATDILLRACVPIVGRKG